MRLAKTFLSTMILMLSFFARPADAYMENAAPTMPRLIERDLILEQLEISNDVVPMMKTNEIFELVEKYLNLKAERQSVETTIAVMDTLREWWLDQDANHQGVCYFDYISSWNQLFLLGQELRLKREIFELKARLATQTYPKTWLKTADETRLRLKRAELDSVVLQAKANIRSRYKIPPDFIFLKMANVRDYINTRQLISREDDNAYRLKLLDSPVMTKNLQRNDRSGFDEFKELLIRKMTRPGGGIDQHMKEAAERREKILASIDRPQPPVRRTTPSPPGRMVEHTALSAHSPLLPARQYWDNEDAARRVKQMELLVASEAKVTLLHPSLGDHEDYFHTQRLSPQAEFLRKLGINSESKRPTTSIDLSDKFNEPLLQIAHGIPTFACVAFALTSDMDFTSQKSASESVVQQIISVFKNTPAQPLSPWYAHFAVSAQMMRDEDLAEREAGTARRQFYDYTQTYLAQSGALSHVRLMAERRRQERESAEKEIVAQEAAYLESLSNDAHRDSEKSRIDHGLEERRRSYAIEYGRDQREIEKLEAIVTNMPAVKSQASLRQLRAVEDDLEARDGRYKLLANYAYGEVYGEDKLLRHGVFLEDAFKVLSLNPIPPLADFPHYGAPLKIDDVKNRTFEIESYALLTADDVAQAQPEIVAPDLNLDFGFFKMIHDHGDDILVAVDTDEEIIQEDWTELTYSRTAKSHLEHIFLVVGYGVEGLNPANLQVEPYLIIRDSLVPESIHYKISAQNLLNHVVSVAKVLAIKKVNQ